MKLFSKTYNIKASIEHVFYCFSDYDYILKEINRLNKHDEVYVVKNKQGLDFKGKSTLFTLKQLEVNTPILYKAKITTVDKNLLRFGNAVLNCSFTEKDNITNVKVEVNSDKNPSFIWWFFVKIILFILKIQSKKDEKLFIQAIEQNA